MVGGLLTGMVGVGNRLGNGLVAVAQECPGMHIVV